MSEEPRGKVRRHLVRMCKRVWAIDENGDVSNEHSFRVQSVKDFINSVSFICEGLYPISPRNPDEVLKTLF